MNDGVVMSEKKNVLLTGATGFIGAHLLNELVSSSDVGTIYVACRKIDWSKPRQRILDAFKKFSIYANADLAEIDKIKMIDGDITQKNLGLSVEDYQQLCENVDVIHHIAARVNHIRPYDVLKGANVDSVADLLEMARTGRSKVVNFVSTLGSAVRVDADGKYVEDFPEEERLNSDMGYLLSKWEAEKLVGDFHRSGGKGNIFRLGYISGHSQTGAALFSDNQFMLFIKSCVQLGYAPELKRLINFTPVDFTAQIMNLPRYMTEGGHVVNLFNYTELISWQEIVAWLNNRGYRIQTLEFYEWQKKLLADGENNALYRFFPLYGTEGAHEKILRFGREIQKFRTEKIEEAAQSHDVYPPKLKFELLDRYLCYLQLQAFLPLPSQASDSVPLQKWAEIAMT
ncbi:thioester reductase domain-containing protein [Chromobacterium violaceum]|nr:thioester reductase domain-containing protein [Chromobacterium violaceum]